MHPVMLRNMLEELFEIDVNYMKVQKQVDVMELRVSHEIIYWNLIWYFTQIQLPYEFLVPYDELFDIVVKEFKKSSKKEDVRRKKTLNELIKQKGVDAVLKEQ